MSEGLTKRVGRIISGSVNKLVDAMENAAPETVMEQALREIDDAIYEVRHEMGKVIAAKHLSTKRLSEKNARHEELSSQTQFAIAEGRDDLAEAAIAAQMDIEAQMPVLEDSIVEAADREDELAGYISALQGKKRDMKDELKAYRQEMAAQSQIAIAAGGNGNDQALQSSLDKKVEEASRAFDRILEKQTGTGLTDHSHDTSAKMQELEQLSRENRIKERLAVLKSQN